MQWIILAEPVQSASQGTRTNHEQKHCHRHDESRCTVMCPLVAKVVGLVGHRWSGHCSPVHVVCRRRRERVCCLPFNLVSGQSPVDRGADQDSLLCSNVRSTMTNGTTTANLSRRSLVWSTKLKSECGELGQ